MKIYESAAISAKLVKKYGISKDAARELIKGRHEDCDMEEAYALLAWYIDTYEAEYMEETGNDAEIRLDKFNEAVSARFGVYMTERDIRSFSYWLETYGRDTVLAKKYGISYSSNFGLSHIGIHNKTRKY